LCSQLFKFSVVREVMTGAKKIISNWRIGHLTPFN